MRGNSHVRFGAGDEETCLGDEVRRFIPTLRPTRPNSHSGSEGGSRTRAVTNRSNAAMRLIRNIRWRRQFSLIEAGALRGLPADGGVPATLAPVRGKAFPL